MTTAADLPRIKGNIARMASQNAPENEIDSYLATEGYDMAKPAHAAMIRHGIDVTGDAAAVRAAIGPFDGAKRADALELWSRHTVDGEHEKVGGFNPVAPDVRDTVSTLARGTPIGQWLPRIGAAMHGAATAIGLDDQPYDESLALANARNNYVDEKAPRASLVGQVAGGLATGGAALALKGPGMLQTAGRVALGGLIPVLNKAGGVVRTIAQSAATGVVLGGNAGLAHTRDLTDVGEAARNTIFGAGASALVGGGLSAGGAALRSLQPAAAAVRRRLTQGPEAATDALLAKIAERSGVSPQEAVIDQQLGKAATNFFGYTGSIPETLAEVFGDAGQRAVRGAMAVPGAASAFGKKFLRDRLTGTRDLYSTEALPGTVAEQQAQMGSRGRILDNLARAFKIKSEKSAYQSEKQIVFAQKTEASPKYQAAFARAKTFDLTPHIEQWRTTLAEEAVGPRVAKIEKVLGWFEKASATSASNPQQGLKMFQIAKEELDDLIGKTLPKGRKNFVAKLIELKHDMLDGVHGGSRAAPSINHRYADARDTFAGHAAVRNAIQLGRAAVKEGADVTADEVAHMTASELVGLRKGILEGSAKTLGAAKTTGDMTDFFRRPNTAAVIKVAMPRAGAPQPFQPKGSPPDPTHPSDQFGEIINREERMMQTHNMGTGGSQTAPMQNDVADLGAWASIGQKLAKEGLTPAAYEAVSQIVNRMFGYREKVAEMLVKRLLSTDPSVIADTLDRIARLHGRAAAAELKQQVNAAYRSILPNALATQAGGNTADAFPRRH
jgi:hypothetical protein